MFQGGLATWLHFVSTINGSSDLPKTISGFHWILLQKELPTSLRLNSQSLRQNPYTDTLRRMLALLDLLCTPALNTLLMTGRRLIKLSRLWYFCFNIRNIRSVLCDFRISFCSRVYNYCCAAFSAIRD